KKVKHNHNISRLKNQSRNLPSHSDSMPYPTPPRSEAPSPELSENDSELSNHFDSLKADFQQENVEDWSDEESEDVGDMDELIELCKEDLMETMVNMMLEDDLKNLDWMLEKLKK
ncbi:hypothetical protein L208DRAFT_1255290, partial [Tricholoma matsutake]